MRKQSMLLSCGIVLVLAALFSYGDDAKPEAEKKTVTDSGLTIIEKPSAPNAGVAAAGDTVWVLYTGKLENGTKFDSSADHAETRNEGISFPPRPWTGDQGLGRGHRWHEGGR